MTYATIIYALLLVAFVGTVVFLLWLSRDQNTAHRKEVADLHLSHREEIAALNQARMEETADLLQRIQAPEQAVTSHVAASASPDPPPVNLSDDQQLFELAEQRVREFVDG